VPVWVGVHSKDHCSRPVAKRSFASQTKSSTARDSQTTECENAFDICQCVGMTADNIATVQRVYDAFKTRDTSVIQKVFAPDITISQSPELPWGGEYRGHDGAFTFFLKLLENIESQVTTESLFAA
jgi:hypothetical protein